MTFQLRRATTEAQKQIIALLDRAIFNEACPAPAIALKELRSSHVVWWLAYAEDSFTPVGYCGIWLPPDKWEASFTRAGVSFAYRRKGLQKQMIQARIAYARKLGYSTVETYVHGDNVASTRALLACGFVPHKASQNRKEGLWLHVSAPTATSRTGTSAKGLA